MVRRRDRIIGIGIGISVLLSLVLLIRAGSGVFSGRGIGVRENDKRIALIEVRGTIVDAGPIIRQLKKYAEDPSVPAMVLRIESPGGGVAASQEIYEKVRQVRALGKKVVASMGSVAASGGYFIAAAADTIVASPASITGSIGVIANIPYSGALFRKIGLDLQVVKSGDYKDMGSPMREMTQQERAMFQEVVDDTYGQFVDAIVAQRNLPKEKVLPIADGRIFTGRKAVTYGLVDVLGTYEDAVDLAAEMVGLEKRPPTTQEKKRFDALELLFGRLGSFPFSSAQTPPMLSYIMCF
ncbi:MAG: signal peptide peptidase SppA [Candidatus Latescibacterota bacterium]